jgi:pyruvate formate lyase activating enzyme
VQQVNIRDPVGQSTYCHQYEQLLISRDWYDLIAWKSRRRRLLQSLRRGLPRLFQGMPGTWSGRQMVMVAPTAVRMPA